MTAALIALVVGTFVPLLTQVITKEVASLKLKAFLSAVLAAIGGGVGAYSLTTGWEPVVISILAAVAVAAAIDFGFWQPTGTSKAFARLAPGFGLGG